MKRQWKLALLLLAAVVLTAVCGVLSPPPKASAANPTTISFQGKVVNSNGTNVTDGTYTFLFKLYTVSSAGTAIWTESDSLAVSNGIFQVNLGAVCPFFTANACNSSTPIDFNASPNLYLGMTFNSDAAGEMTPRVQMQSVPFAFNADRVGGLTANQLVQLNPGSQQTGAINVSGNITSAGTIQGGTLVSSALNATSAGATVTTNLGTLQRTASGITNIDLSDPGTTTLQLWNSGSGVANLNLYGGSLQTGTTPVTRLDNAGNLTNIGTIGASGLATLSGGASVSEAAATTLAVAATGVTRTADLVNISNAAGQEPTADGINALQASWYAKPATGNFSSDIRLNVTNNNTTTAGQVQALRVVATGAGGAINSDTVGIYIDPLTNSSTGSAGENALEVGTGWDNVLAYNGAGIINGSGVLLSAALSGTYSGALFLTGTTNTYAGASLSVSGAGTFGGAVAANGGSITSTATTFNLLNTTVTTANLLGAATTISLGAATGTLTLNNATTTVHNLNTSNTTATLFNTTATTISAFGAATTLTLGGNTASSTVNIGTAAPVAAASQIVNIGTTVSATTGTTTINIGSTSASTNGKTVVKIIAGNNSGSTTAGNSTGVQVSLGNTASTVAVCSSLAAATAATSGTAYELRDCSGTPTADYAENYPVAQGVDYGDIVAVGAHTVDTYGTDSAASGAPDWNKVIGQVTQLVKTTRQYQDSTIGIVSDNHGSFSSTGYNIKDEDNPMPVALNGRVPVKVSSHSPAIAAGDWITTSADSGKATKATSAGYVIGKALAAWDPASEAPTVIVFVQPGFYPGSGAAATSVAAGDTVLSPKQVADGALSLDSGSAASVAIDNSAVQSPADITKQLLAHSGISQDNSVTAASDSLQINAGSDLNNPASVNFNNDQSLKFTDSKQGVNFVSSSSSTSGTITTSSSYNSADAIKLDNTSAQTPIATAIELMNSGGAGYSTLIDAPSFTVSGHGDVTAAGDLNMHTAALSGGLSVGGDANFAGLTTFQKLATFIGKTVFRQDVQFDGHITVASDTAGYASLKTGETKVHIKFTTAYDQAPIISASIVNGQFALTSISNVTPQGFDISLSAPATADTMLSWTAIAAANPLTATNTPAP